MAHATLVGVLAQGNALIFGDPERKVLRLPKASAFACQYPAALFGQCDPRVNISCVGHKVYNNVHLWVPAVSSRKAVIGNVSTSYYYERLGGQSF